MAARSTSNSAHHRFSEVKDRQHGAEPVARAHDGNDGAASLESRLADFGSRRPNGTRAPISPPPLRRSSGAHRIHDTNRIDRSPWKSRAASPTILSSGSSDSVSTAGPAIAMAQPATPQPSANQRHSNHRSSSMRTPNRGEDGSSNWTVDGIADQLDLFRQDIRDGHAQLTAYILESTQATERRVRNGTDLFAGVVADPLKQKSDDSMRVKLKVGMPCDRLAQCRLTVWTATSQDQKGSEGGSLCARLHNNKQGTRSFISLPSRRNQEECPHPQHHADLCASFARPGNLGGEQVQPLA